MNNLKCNSCGYQKKSQYLHDVCPRCKGSMHIYQEKSLLSAMRSNDQKLIKEIERRANKGNIVRII